jgi:hypothetical protein
MIGRMALTSLRLRQEAQINQQEQRRRLAQIPQQQQQQQQGIDRDPFSFLGDFCGPTYTGSDLKKISGEKRPVQTADKPKQTQAIFTQSQKRQRISTADGELTSEYLSNLKTLLSKHTSKVRVPHKFDFLYNPADTQQEDDYSRVIADMATTLKTKAIRITSKIQIIKNTLTKLINNIERFSDALDQVDGYNLVIACLYTDFKEDFAFTDRILSDESLKPHFELLLNKGVKITKTQALRAIELFNYTKLSDIEKIYDAVSFSTQVELAKSSPDVAEFLCGPNSKIDSFNKVWIKKILENGTSNLLEPLKNTLSEEVFLSRKRAIHNAVSSIFILEPEDLQYVDTLRLPQFRATYKVKDNFLAKLHNKMKNFISSHSPLHSSSSAQSFDEDSDDSSDLIIQQTQTSKISQLKDELAHLRQKKSLTRDDLIRLTQLTKFLDENPGISDSIPGREIAQASDRQASSVAISDASASSSRSLSEARISQAPAYPDKTILEVQQSKLSKLREEIAKLRQTKSTMSSADAVKSAELEHFVQKNLPIATAIAQKQTVYLALDSSDKRLYPVELALYSGPSAAAIDLSEDPAETETTHRLPSFLEATQAYSKTKDTDPEDVSLSKALAARQKLLQNSKLNEKLQKLDLTPTNITELFSLLDQGAKFGSNMLSQIQAFRAFNIVENNEDLLQKLINNLPKNLKHTTLKKLIEDRMSKSIPINLHSVELLTKSGAEFHNEASISNLIKSLTSNKNFERTPESMEQAYRIYLSLESSAEAVNYLSQYMDNFIKNQILARRISEFSISESRLFIDSLAILIKNGARFEDPVLTKKFINAITFNKRFDGSPYSDQLAYQAYKSLEFDTNSLKILLPYMQNSTRSFIMERRAKDCLDRASVICLNSIELLIEQGARFGNTPIAHGFATILIRDRSIETAFIKKVISALPEVMQKTMNSALEPRDSATEEGSQDPDLTKRATEAYSTYAQRL